MIDWDNQKGVNLYHADCMEIMKSMPDNWADLAICDPPYGIGDFNQTVSRKIHKKIKWNNSIPRKEYFSELKRVSKNRIIWGANYYGKYIDDVGRIIHDKVANTGAQLKELSDADIASHSFGVNIKVFRFGWRGNVQGNTINWKNTGKNGRIHPCQKPVELYDWLLSNYAKPTDRILDTHLGSGSSAIAAHYFGCDFVGCEIDADYFDAAEMRFTEATRQQVLI